MRELPSGTVTFLFTDMESSTRLLQELGDRYADVLAEHRRLAREVFSRHEGVEVDTQGDAFFVAFARARDAVAAARDTHDVLHDGAVRVRIGIHTGEPIVTAEGYVGIDVHRAARIMGAAHGGQTLLSEATRKLLGSMVDVRDLGEHRLKDIAGSTRLFQLGQRDFPPPRTLNASNLPLPVTALVGRKEELDDALGLLRHERARVLTVTGPGGVGKTRFALEVALNLVEDCADGVWFVDLAPLGDPALVVPTIAATVGATGELEDHLTDKEMLLLLDNVERVIGAAPDLGALVASSRNLQLLVTSREPLHLRHEHQVGLEPLTEAPAAELFYQRAVAVRRRFDAPRDAVVEMCRRVDFLPLGIELLAARVKAIDTNTLLSLLERGLPVVKGSTRDVPDRQRTLRATIEWSYQLLDDAACGAFCRLAIFEGGCSLDAAEEVAEVDVDTLESLVDKSLVRHDLNGRFWLLETVREYALEQLRAGGEAAETARRHAEYFLARAEQATQDRDHGIREPEWATWGAQERGNLYASLAFFRKLGDRDRELRLAGALARFHAVAVVGERRRLLADALDAQGAVPPELAAQALLDLGHLAGRQGDVAAKRAAVERSHALFMDLGDKRGAAWALLELAAVDVLGGDLARAGSRYEECGSMFRESGDSAGLAAYLNDRSYLSLLQKDYPGALQLVEEAMTLRRRLGLHEGDVLLFNAGLALLELNRIAEAKDAYRRGLERAVAIGDRSGFCVGLAGVASVFEREHRRELAARLLGAAESFTEEIGFAVTGAELDALERLRTSLARQLGSRLAELVAEGRTMHVQAAVAEAISAAGIDSPPPKQIE